MKTTMAERPGLFTAEECAAIVALAAQFPAERGGVLGEGGYAPDPRIRDVTTTYLPRGEATAWLYDRLDRGLAEVAAIFGTSVTPIREPIQCARYATGDHFNTWHSDAGADLGEARIVSASVELSPVADYDGGLLEIVPDRIGVARVSEAGTMTAFPSRALHRVTPVTRGVRRALVLWAGA